MDDKAKYTEQVRRAEADFADRVREAGMAVAFTEFAAEDAVINRGDVLYKGRKEISAYMERGTLTEVTLEWEPDFVDVAESGDMAYTYGPYRFAARDSAGNQIEASGIFHTVWKRQADGSWKYVWD